MAAVLSIGHLLRLGLLLTPHLAAQDAQVHSLASLLSSKGFVRIPAGQFTMGSRTGNPDEQPVRRVRIARSFEMSRYEITQAQWDSVMRDPHADPDTRERADPAANPSKFKDPQRPVESVSWDAVQAFIRELNIRDPKHTYRLPTEAEWEYAARAGSAGDRPENLDAIAWYAHNSGGETHPVGQKKPNAWGLYDMYGNVLEWVQDWYAPDAYGAAATTDPYQASPSSYKVYRGCGWHSETKYCRPAFRAFDFPTQGQYSVGFRLVRTRK
jgi:formylglycine-generating enzyme required for sulfatase activity